MSNPWNFESIEDFHFYCCPECDEKTKLSQDLVNHAVQSHADSIPTDILNSFKLTESKTIKEENENDVKHENFDEEVDISDADDIQDDLLMPNQDKIDLNDPNKTEIDTFHCDLCNDNFIKEEVYLEHFETVHQVVKPNLNIKEKIECEVCHKSFSHKDSFRRHLKRIHQITKSLKTGQFECEVCHKGYNNKEYLDKHKKEKHQIPKIPNLKSHKCNLCDILFSTTLEFTEHIEETHKVESGYKCDTCDIIIATRSQFHSHLRIKKHLKDDQIWKCDECDITFEARWSRDYHRDTVHREMSTTCDKCGKLCSSQRHLVIHMRRYHHSYAISKDQKVKKCDKCDTNFRIANDFDEHLSSLHKCDKDFKCKECDTTWVSHLSLELHYIEKHEKFMFCCDICGYIAEQAAIVRRHRRNTHEGKKDHVCHICGKSFTKPWRVVGHMALDHGIGECRFKCDYCGKGFLDNTSKSRHIEGAHEKTKVYKCDLCPYSGHSKNAMQKHKLRKHKN